MAEWLRWWLSNHGRFVYSGFESHQRRKLLKFREMHKKLSKLSTKNSEIQRKCQRIETQSRGWEGNIFLWYERHSVISMSAGPSRRSGFLFISTYPLNHFIDYGMDRELPHFLHSSSSHQKLNFRWKHRSLRHVVNSPEPSIYQKIQQNSNPTIRWGTRVTIFQWFLWGKRVASSSVLAEGRGTTVPQAAVS